MIFLKRDSKLEEMTDRKIIDCSLKDNTMTFNPDFRSSNDILNRTDA